MSIYLGIKKILRILISCDIQWWVALRHGVAPSIEHLAVLGQLQLETIIDIGANRGQFALLARHIFSNAYIVSFEPLPGPIKIFRRVFRGDARVQLYESAIGPKSGESLIHVSERDDSSSLLPIGPEQTRLFPGTAQLNTQYIKVSRLCDCIDPEDIVSPAMLKLDVQGYELSCLLGCENLLHRFAWVYAECSFIELYEGQSLADEVIAWMHLHGFILCGVYNMTYDRLGQAVQADFLFSR